jgi:hypothetical protein
MCVNKNSHWNWYMHANYEVEWWKKNLSLNPNTKTKIKPKEVENKYRKCETKVQTKV